jgi:hypothetical protein
MGRIDSAGPQGRVQAIADHPPLTNEEPGVLLEPYATKEAKAVRPQGGGWPT